MNPHWYKIHIEACPVCMKTITSRERVYGDPPKDPADRYTYDEIYDYCNQ